MDKRIASHELNHKKIVFIVKMNFVPIILAVLVVLLVILLIEFPLKHPINKMKAELRSRIEMAGFEIAMARHARK